MATERPVQTHTMPEQLANAQTFKAIQSATRKLLTRGVTPLLFSESYVFGVDLPDPDVDAPNPDAVIGERYQYYDPGLNATLRVDEFNTTGQEVMLHAAGLPIPEDIGGFTINTQASLYVEQDPNMFDGNVRLGSTGKDSRVMVSAELDLDPYGTQIASRNLYEGAEILGLGNLVVAAETLGGGRHEFTGDADPRLATHIKYGLERVPIDD